MLVLRGRSAHRRHVEGRRACCIAMVIVFWGLLAGEIQAQNITLAPVITTVAGTGAPGFSGEGGPAFLADIDSTGFVKIDASGNLYLSEYNNDRIRKIDTSGKINTVAGNGTQGYMGDGGPATSAEIFAPVGTAVDSAGNLYFADQSNQAIRKVDSSGKITTIAGGPGAGHTGDGGPAINAKFDYPAGIALDKAGNLFIVDVDNEIIRKIDTGGTITTAAGTYSLECINTGHAPCFGGDGGPAAGALFNLATDVATDKVGNYFIADSDNHRIRRVDSGGTITTVAGNGTAGFAGDGGPAINAEINLATVSDKDHGAVTVDSNGNLYIPDFHNSRIRRVSAGGTITTIAGNGTPGFSGDGGPAVFAELLNPSGIAVDGAGNLYFRDNNRIRMVSTPTGVDFGTVNVGSNHALDMFVAVNAALTLSSVQGGGDFSVVSDSCAPPAALAAGTVCIVHVQFAPTQAGPRSALLVAKDSGSNTFSFPMKGVGVGSGLAYTPGTINTIVGNGTSGYNGDNIPASTAEVSYPAGVVLDGASNLFIADTVNNRVRKVDATGKITTIAGTGSPLCVGTYDPVKCYGGDGGAATSALLYRPTGLVFDSAGNLYISEVGNQVVRKVDLAGKITTVAGNTTSCSSPSLACGDGSAATSAQLNNPVGMALDSSGSLYIADQSDNRIRKVDTSGKITTVAGDGNYGYTGDGGQATGTGLYYPTGVAFDSVGNLFIADNYDHRIRKVTPAGIISTVVGDGVSGYTGDNGAAATAELSYPFGVAFDIGGALYISDRGNYVFRKVDTGGTITTLAGNGSFGFSGDGGPATSAQFLQADTMVVDGKGLIYITDTFNHRIRTVDVTIPPTLDFGTLNVGQTSAAQSVGLSNVGNAPLNFVGFSEPTNFQSATVGNDCVAGAFVVGASCRVGVAFAPTVAGNPLTGTLFIFDNLPSSPQGVALTGIANAAVLDSVTVDTSPTGRSFSVDGTQYSSTQNFNWSDGSQHTIATTSPQAASAGAQYLFSGWSDSGSLSHSVIASAATTSYIASFNQTAAMTSPAPGSKLSSASATFQWTAGTGVTQYSLYIGTTAGAHDIDFVNAGAATSATVNNLPTNGGTFYVTLYSLIQGAWQPNASKYIASGSGTPAAMTSPTPGSTLASTSATFMWSAGAGVSQYSLYIGTTPGAHDIAFLSAGTSTSKTVNNLPNNGGTFYVTLNSLIGASWRANGYQYVASGAGVAATMTSPVPGTTFAGANVTFVWTAGSGVSQYSMYIGKTAGAHDINSVNAHLGTSASFTNLPTDGREIYVTLFSIIGGKYYSHAYSYVAAGTPAKAVMSSPANGATITGANATFNWTPGTGVTSYSLYVGTAKGAHDLDYVATSLNSASVTNLPAAGGTIYVRLYSLIDGVWQYNDYSYVNP